MKRLDVYCEKCTEEILHRSELVTAFYFLRICAYHTSCYSEELKEMNGLILSSTPINSIGTNVVLVISFVASFGIIVYYGFWTYTPLTFILPSIRAISWFLYERHLP